MVFAIVHTASKCHLCEASLWRMYTGYYRFDCRFDSVYIIWSRYLVLVYSVMSGRVCNHVQLPGELLYLPMLSVRVAILLALRHTYCARISFLPLFFIYDDWDLLFLNVSLVAILLFCLIHLHRIDSSGIMCLNFLLRPMIRDPVWGGDLLSSVVYDE